ncbi:hypothetical protein [Parerythrobacter jejuensis]|uniref:Uncharacterized protein n=1 Tax=Parerythrobacter jejuensis TaxID=795812 RepID=A0A845AJI8_9SPHN|nr:hypothetical protein [Parerythrobacter jejuensis]MXP30410.1 hypothetical protein [Parerythrobacter jejuensis]MXP33170.1 hypothetical protein [Parerythrobacter jejuensis]
MPTRIQEDALLIRKHIREAEAVTDEAMIACSKLKQVILRARQNPEVGVDAAQKAMIRLAHAEQQALEMSSNLLRVHEELNKVSREYMGPGDGDGETYISPSAIETHQVAKVG